MTTVICDLDGTLFNVDHRIHYLQEQNYKDFYGAVRYDTPNEWCVDLLNALKQYGTEIVFVSGRSEQAKEDTITQLVDLGFGRMPLFMRPAKDWQADYLFKRSVYYKELRDRDILFVLEDRKQVVDMWRALGLTVLQCDEGSF